MDSINYELLCPGMIPSPLQKAVYEHIKTSKNHLAIKATAGSGKTTTIITSLSLIPKFKRTIFLSFSNAIVDSLKERVPSGVRASTLHSLGMDFITKYYPGIRMNDNKYCQLAIDYYGTKTKEVYKNAYKIQDISRFIRLTLTPLELHDVEKMCTKYDIDYDDELIEIAIQLIKADLYPHNIDFADMIYLPATREDMIRENFHFVFIDEAQDMNQAQIEFARNLLKPDGRLITVGDPFQSIYGFSGSDTELFHSLTKADYTDVLPLSVSYRCAKAIVHEAQKLCPEITALPTAKEGLVRWGDLDEVEEGDMVLSRNNAPLISAYFYFIEKDMKAKVYGKDIEKGIIQLAEKTMAKTIDKMQENLLGALDTLRDELLRKGFKRPIESPRYQSLEDKVDLLNIILNKVRSTMEVIPLIRTIFVENDGEGVKLLSCHRAKGLENDRVFLMKHYNGNQLIPNKFATQEWQLKQECNLEFVAITRAREELVYFDYDDKY